MAGLYRAAEVAPPLAGHIGQKLAWAGRFIVLPLKSRGDTAACSVTMEDARTLVGKAVIYVVSTRALAG